MRRRGGGVGSPYARPKSESLALQRPWVTSSRRTFSVLMSDYTNLFSCTWATPFYCPLGQLDVCQGVDHVHENGFVHPDIKFENVLLEEVAHGRCSAKLSDFGLAYGEPTPPSSSSSCYHNNQYPSVDVSELSNPAAKHEKNRKMHTHTPTPIHNKEANAATCERYRQYPGGSPFVSSREAMTRPALDRQVKSG